MFFPKFGSGKVPLFTMQARMVPGTEACIHPAGTNAAFETVVPAVSISGKLRDGTSCNCQPLWSSIPLSSGGSQGATGDAAQAETIGQIHSNEQNR